MREAHPQGLDIHFAINWNPAVVIWARNMFVSMKKCLNGSCQQGSREMMRGEAEFHCHRRFPEILITNVWKLD